MAWYRSGTVNLTSGSASIVGAATAWIGGGINIGDVFTADNVTLYEIQDIASDTSLTLDRPFAGSTASGASYAIIRNFSPNGAAMMTSLTALTGAVDTLISTNAEPYLGMAAAFQPSAQTVPNMTIAVASAIMLVAGVPSVVSAQNTATLVPPVSHPRLDLVVADLFTGVVSVIAGTEAASPVLPTLPAGYIPIAQLSMSVGMTAIGSAQITDLRPVFKDGLAQGYLNAQSYGAVGDGATHNATALQAAINAATLAAGGYVFDLLIPAGLFLVEATLNVPSNIRLRGVGAIGDHTASWGTRLQRTGNFTLLNISGTLGGTQTQCVYLDDINLDGYGSIGSGTYTADLVVVSSAYELKFSRVWFSNCAGRALKATQLWDSRFVDCRVTYCGSQDGTLPAVSLLSPTSNPDETCNNLYFWGCRFEDNPGVALECTGNNTVDIWLTDCKFESPGLQLDYMLRVSEGTGIHFGGQTWMYAAPTGWAGKSWSDTTTPLTPVIGTINLTIATGDTTIYAAGSTEATPVGMSVLVYKTGSGAGDIASHGTYMTGRVNSYNSATGAIQIITDQAVYPTGSGAITGWTIVPCHPGLFYAYNSQLIDGAIIGGVEAALPGSATAYTKAFAHLDSCNSCELDLRITQGTNTLIGNSLLAYKDTSTNGSVGPGSHNFTIEPGLSITAQSSSATGTILYIYGNSAGTQGGVETTANTATDWMVGLVTAYNSSTGALTVQVAQYGWSGVEADVITSWLLIPSPAKAILLTNGANANNKVNKVNVKGSASPYTNLAATVFTPQPILMESLTVTSYGNPTITFQNQSFQDQLILEHIPSFQEISGVWQPTGAYQLYVYDFARSGPYNIALVDGNRNLSIEAPTFMRNLLRWYDTSDGASTPGGTNGSYNQITIKGSIWGAGNLPLDANNNLAGAIGDVWLNSALASTGEAYGAPIVERFVCVAPNYASGSTTVPAVWMTPPPLELSGPRANVPSSASGYAPGTRYRYTDPIAGDFAGQIVVSNGSTLVWKTVEPISA